MASRPSSLLDDLYSHRRSGAVARISFEWETRCGVQNTVLNSVGPPEIGPKESFWYKAYNKEFNTSDGSYVYVSEATSTGCELPRFRWHGFPQSFLTQHDWILDLFWIIPSFRIPRHVFPPAFLGPSLRSCDHFLDRFRPDPSYFLPARPPASLLIRSVVTVLSILHLAFAPLYSGMSSFTLLLQYRGSNPSTSRNLSTPAVVCFEMW